MSQVLDHGQFDPQRVAEFLDDFMNSTGHSDLGERTQELDRRIHSATLSLVDKVEVLKNLAPRAEDDPVGAKTGDSRELRMARLILSVALQDLPLFKFALEYDGDYKDLEEYIFHDIDDKQYQDRILEYFRTIPQSIGIKVLSDVDDTMYANLIDERYPEKTLYPGVLEFYDALKHEPFPLGKFP